MRSVPYLVLPAARVWCAAVTPALGTRHPHRQHLDSPSSIALNLPPRYFLGLSPAQASVVLCDGGSFFVLLALVRGHGVSFG